MGRTMNLKPILYWLFVAFLVYLSIELLRKILGGSLGFEELVIALLIANIGYSFHLKEAINKIDAKMAGHIGWHKGNQNVHSSILNRNKKNFK